MTFTASRGVVFCHQWAMTDADAVAVGEVFRAELHAAIAARDDQAVRIAQDCLHNLSRAQHDARTYRTERARAIRLEAFNREHRSAA